MLVRDARMGGAVMIQYCCHTDLEYDPRAIAVYGDQPVPVVRLDALKVKLETMRDHVDGPTVNYDWGYKQACKDLLALLERQS